MLSMPRIVRPDSSGILRRKLVSPLDRPLADPLSETKNWQKLLIQEFLASSKSACNIYVFYGKTTDS